MVRYMSYIKVLNNLNSKLKEKNCDALEYFITEFKLSEEVAESICKYLNKKLDLDINKKHVIDISDTYIDKIYSLLSSQSEVQKLTVDILGHNLTVDIDTNQDGIADDSLLVSPEEYHRHKEALIKYFVTMGICCIVLLLCLGYVFGVTFFSEHIPEAHARFIDQSLSSIYNVISMIIVVICNNANISMQLSNTNKNQQNQNNLKGKKPEIK